jgi:hypothetical protein
MYRLSVLAVALFLSAGWWNASLSATAEALGTHTSKAIDLPTPPPTIDAGCEWDPLGRCITG